jgi:hypothetical protein
MTLVFMPDGSFVYSHPPHYRAVQHWRERQAELAEMKERQARRFLDHDDALSAEDVPE